MNLKQEFENHSVIFVGAAMLTSFTAGWVAHTAVQSAAGRTTVSVESAKRLESADSERQAYITRIVQLEAGIRNSEVELNNLKGSSASSSRPNTSEASAAGKKTFPASTSKGGSQQNSEIELPVTVGEIQLEGGPVQTAKLNTDISVSVDYIVKPGYTVKIWIRPSGGACAYLYEPSGTLAGSGRITRTFTSASPCTVDKLDVIAQHGDSTKDRILKSGRFLFKFVP